MKYLTIILMASMLLFVACTPSELDDTIPDIPELEDEIEDEEEQEEIIDEDPIGEDDDTISGIVDEDENIDIGDMI